MRMILRKTPLKVYSNLKVTLKKNVATFSTEKNATVTAIQSVHSNVGTLVAK